MTYRTIEAQIGIIHANILDLNHYLQHTRIGDLTDTELIKTESLLHFLRKHLDKPVMMPRLRNPLPE